MASLGPIVQRIKVPWRRAFATGRLPVVESCPAPTCSCRDMPDGLDIDREKSLKSTIPAYAEQLIISTGKSDWTSRIEDDNDGELVRFLKSYIAPKGKYFNPLWHVMLTHSSFATPKHESSSSTASAYLLPSFRYVPAIPLQDSAVDNFVQAFVLPTKAPMWPPSDETTQQHVPLQQPELQASFPGVRDVDEILVLICSHGTRDNRCGKLGPVLQAEFEEKLNQHGLHTSSAHSRDERPGARVGLISHIGGHRWAGNVIIYIPPKSEHPLAGMGIWYGRVAPEHVEGIVRETILGGRIIQDMFRGGIDKNRTMHWS